MKDPIRISDEVGHALADRRPVVALETTLVAHGFPPGEGVAVGLESERRVRDAGAVPATIGVLDVPHRTHLDRIRDALQAEHQAAVEEVGRRAVPAPGRPALVEPTAEAHDVASCSQR